MKYQYLIIPALLFSLKIGHVERYILALMISFGGSTYASNATMARMFGVTRQAIIDAVNKLKERGYIECEYVNQKRIMRLAGKETLPLQILNSKDALPGNGQDSLLRTVKNLDGGSKESLPNNKEISKSIQQQCVVNDDLLIIPEGIKREFSTVEALRQYFLDCNQDIGRMGSLLSQAKATGKKNPTGAAIAAARGGYDLAQADPESLCSIPGCREPFCKKTSAGGEIVRLCEGHYTEYRNEFPDGGPYMGLFIKNYQQRSCKNEIAV